MWRGGGFDVVRANRAFL